MALTNTDIFTPGSWWIHHGERVVAGGPDPTMNFHAPAQNRVYLYHPGKKLPHMFLSLVTALKQIESGDLLPDIDDDLSYFAEKEQDYYRRG